MTYRQAITTAIRNFILNAVTGAVVTDITTNGLTTADEAVIDSYLDTTMP